MAVALSLAKAGWPVFPVHAETKEPLVKGGFKSASRDERMIREWWRRHPDAGVALAIPEGVLVVDVDPRNGGVTPTGLPETRTTRTRNGGVHLFFLVNVDEMFVAQAAPGVDLKSAGKGYVILPPTPGYTWENAGYMAGLPKQHVEAWQRTYVLGDSIEAGPAKYLPWEAGTRYGLVALANQLEKLSGSRNGERNNTLYRAAAGLYALVAGGELSEDKVSTDMLDAALEAGLDKEEAINTLMSARSRGSANPRRSK